MKKSFVGGQAVLEGVLMVFEDEYAVAVQTPDGIHVEKHSSPILKSKFLRIPFFRGIVALIAMTSIGLKAMMYSSQQSSEEDEELSTFTLIVTLIITMLLAVTLFKFVPLATATWLVSSQQPILFNLVDGLLRIALFVSYIALISRLPDIKRLFAYHGAEHKVINAHEQGKLTLSNARKQSRFNPRCGTTFVVLVLLVAILVYSVTPLDYPLFQLLLLRLAFLLPIASISYEIIRFSFTRTDNFFIRLLLAPGYWVQRLTVREPNDQQLRVALAAVKAVLKK
jgi:uncharacterized protein YqhQ